MFFHLSKLFWLLASPESLFIALVLAAQLSLLLGRRKTAGACVAVLAALVIFPAGSWLLRPLENTYTRPAWPDHVDGILVLGGGLGSKILYERGVDAAEPSVVRLIAAAELARRYPQARLVFSGGNGDGSDGKTDAFAARTILTEMGVPAGHVLYEDRSRNTYENIALSQALVKPAKGQAWLLVTSAFHMPRAMAVARKAGWAMIPWPSDYRTGTHISLFHPALAANLVSLDLAVHEWIGLLAYHWSGKAA